MNGNVAVDLRNPVMLRKAGMDALVKELGVVDAVRFIRQYDPGHGDYTKERGKLLEGITMDELIKEVRKLDEANAKQE